MVSIQKIKIMHIIGSLGVGGCENQLLGLFRRINKTRFDTTLLWYSPAEDERRRQFKDTDVRMLFLDKFSMPLWKFFFNLRRAIRDIAPDIVHTWMYSANFWGRWAALTCRVPCLVASYRNEVTEATESSMVPRLSEKFLSSRSCKIANSRAVALSLNKFYKIPLDDIYIIPNAVGFESHDMVAARKSIRRELGLPEEQKIVLMVANQRNEKNYPLFIRTAHRVCTNRSDVTFVAVGRTDMAEELSALVHEYNLNGRVIFTGQRHYIDLWYAGSDIFCLTSKVEGCPNVLLEAMFDSLPVVSTSFTAAHEIIRHTKTGVLVPLDDDKVMADEIIKLLNDPVRSLEIGTAGEAFVKQYFSWENVLSKMESLYMSIAG